MISVVDSSLRGISVKAFPVLRKFFHLIVCNTNIHFP